MQLFCPASLKLSGSCRFLTKAVTVLIQRECLVPRISLQQRKRQRLLHLIDLLSLLRSREVATIYAVLAKIIPFRSSLEDARNFLNT